MERLRLNADSGKVHAGGSYFEAPSACSFVSSGCTVLDCVLGGGWAMGRVANVVGDKSTGKTLLAIEACANFLMTYNKGRIRYREVEAAFDKPYARALGMPVDRIDFGESFEVETVEDLYEDMKEFLKKLPKGRPGMYVLDSLDPLSDDAEMARGMSENSYGAEKAKKMSQLFRRMVRKMSKRNVFVMIISQVRDKIGVTFGRKVSRTGGKALDFYASQVIYLSQMGRIKKTRERITRPIGVDIKAGCDKNKVGLPFRECEFPLLFGFGVDDVAASVNWLAEVGKLQEAGLTKAGLKGYLRKVEKMSSRKYNRHRVRMAKVVKRVWRQTEKNFVSQRRKYGQEEN